jgi:hypothetical protein
MIVQLVNNKFEVLNSRGIIPVESRVCGGLGYCCARSSGDGAASKMRYEVDSYAEIDPG